LLQAFCTSGGFVGTETIEHGLDDLAQIAALPIPFEDAFPFPERRRDYAAFWQKAKEISSLFRSVPLPQETRARLWSRYDTLCREVKKLQTREREQRAEQSRLNKEQIQILIADTRSWTSGSENAAHLQQAQTLLRRAMDQLKEASLVKDDREACWVLWREANRDLGFKCQEIRECNYHAFEHQISEVSSLATYEDPYEALRRAKEIRQHIWEADLSKDQRGWLLEALQKWRDTASRRIDERKAEREQRRRTWVESKIDGLGEWVARNEALVARIEEEIDDLEEKIRSAWNEEWADRARGRVEEKYRKIADIERTNEELSEKIGALRAA